MTNPSDIINPPFQRVAPDPPEGEPRSKSGPGMCTDSPDTMHWWDRQRISGQWCEEFSCRWCPAEVVD